MVNEWYIAKLCDCRNKVNTYEKQVERFCELRASNALSSLVQSQTYRQLEFGLKELYRLTGYLKNYCMLNKQAIDKILKKHDKNSYFDSRGTINTALSNLSFCRQRNLPELMARVESLWRKFIGDNKSRTMNDLRVNIEHKYPATNGFLIGMNVDNAGGSVIHRLEHPLFCLLQLYLLCFM